MSWLSAKGQSSPGLAKIQDQRELPIGTKPYKPHFLSSCWSASRKVTSFCDEFSSNRKSETQESLHGGVLLSWLELLLSSTASWPPSSHCPSSSSSWRWWKRPIDLKTWCCLFGVFLPARIDWNPSFQWLQKFNIVFSYRLSIVKIVRNHICITIWNHLFCHLRVSVWSILSIVFTIEWHQKTFEEASQHFRHFLAAPGMHLRLRWHQHLAYLLTCWAMISVDSQWRCHFSLRIFFNAMITPLKLDLRSFQYNSIKMLAPPT